MINKYHSYTISRHKKTLGFSGVLFVNMFLISVCFLMGFTYPQSSVTTLTATPSLTGTSSPLPTSTISPTETPQPSSTGDDLPVEKDWWDKAGVISQFFFSGVVIAVVGLLITYTIQQTQIKVSQDTSAAQIKSAEIQATEDRRLQQGQLTAQLVEHLTSDSDEVREIAIVALRESVPEKIYDSVVEILARSDKSTKVREKAIQQLGLSQNNEVAVALDKIATDPNRSDDERNLASKSANRVILSSKLTSGTFVLTAASQFGHAIESAELQAGVFTHFLVQGLGGKADLDADGTITAAELSKYVIEQVALYGKQNRTQNQEPTFAIESQGELPIVGINATYSSVTGLIIGINKFADPNIATLRYATQDAGRLYKMFSESKINSTQLHLLLDENATRNKVLEILETVTAKAQKDSLFIFYYAGMGIREEGELNLFPNDSIVHQPNTLLPFSFIKSSITRTQSIAKVIFLDTDFSGGIGA